MDNDFFLNTGYSPPRQLGHASSMPVWWQSSFSAPDMDTTSNIPSSNHHFSVTPLPPPPQDQPSTATVAAADLFGIINGFIPTEISPPPPPARNSSLYTAARSSSPDHLMAAAENNYPPPPHSLHLQQQAIPPPLTSSSSSSSLFLGSTAAADLSCADPSFSARFSSFGSRSFNGRTTATSTATNPFVNNGSEFPPKPPVNPSSVVGVGGEGAKRKLQRVFSSPALKVNEAERKVKRFFGPDRLLGCLREEFPSSGAVESDGSGFGPVGVGGGITTDVVNPRKRRSSSGLPIDGSDNPVCITTTTSLSSHANAFKGEDEGGNRNQPPCAKRRRSTEPAGKAVEEKGNDGSKKQGGVVVGGGRGKEKLAAPSEPPKDYIHVRARRGQATDSHSLAERVRREKISERMKLLEDLVPGCNKVVGKALMLEEIINYVQSLQRQVEFLSMKLATVNQMEFNTDNYSSPDQAYQKDIFQDNCSMQKQQQQQQQQANHPTQIMDYSIGQQQQHHQSVYRQSPHRHQQCNSTGISQSSRSTSGVPADQVLVHHDSIDSHSDGCSLQFPFFDEPPLYLCESDIQALVQMGFFKNGTTTAPCDNDDYYHDALQSQPFHGLNQASVANES